jgi:hypothetical protein
MWNRSYRWQRRARVAAGMLAVAAILFGLFWLRGSAEAQRAVQGARDLAAEMAAGNTSLVEVDVPSQLKVAVGTLVYGERADGVAHVIGRAASVEARTADTTRIGLRLFDNLAPTGGTLKGAAATINLHSAMQLLIVPDLLGDEVRLARDAIWPSLRANVMPGMVEALVHEIARESTKLHVEDQAIVASSIEELRKSLKPLEEELVTRLAERAKDTIGLKGVVSGVWRTSADGVHNSGAAVADLWRWAVGREVSGERVDRPFFSEETSQALAAAVEEETMLFWQDHQVEVIQAMTKVAMSRREEITSAFNERWARRLYERAVLPAWLAGQEQVIESVQLYANDFAARRLLTSGGGPRLLFAYALRCAVGISDDPLLIFAPDSQRAPGRIVYESLVQ